jgi:hypothetical protein
VLILTPFLAATAAVALSYLGRPEGFLAAWLEGIERAPPRRLAASRVERAGVAAALRQWLDPARPLGECEDMVEVVVGRGASALDGLRELLTAPAAENDPAVRRCAARALAGLCRLELPPEAAARARELLSALRQDSDAELAALARSAAGATSDGE